GSHGYAASCSSFKSITVLHSASATARCKVIFGRASLMSIFRVRGQNVSQNIELAPRFKAVCTVLNPLFFSIFY
ncbi:hypothetical protein, partial [Pseudomonas lactis]|uniref:hypothetical protein n=1 Tax=Pseudomonas lactis TaxID=1615674 RepID=UPI003F801FD8